MALHKMCIMDGWRVWVGDSCLLESDANVIYTKWSYSRDALSGWLKPFLADTCPDCHEQGTEAYERLRKLPEGREFAAEVDGDFYLLLRGDHPLGEDAVAGLVSLATQGR